MKFYDSKRTLGAIHRLYNASVVIDSIFYKPINNDFINLYWKIIPKELIKKIKIELTNEIIPQLIIYQFLNGKWVVLSRTKYNSDKNFLSNFIQKNNLENSSIHIENYGKFNDNDQLIFYTDYNRLPTSAKCILTCNYEFKNNKVKVLGNTPWGKTFRHIYFNPTI